MKKILIVSVGKLSGGVEKYSLMLDKYLENEEYEVHFAVRKNGWLSENIANERMIQMDMSKTHIFKSMKLLKKYVKDNNIDILHCNSNNGIFVSKFVKRSVSRKKIGVIHGDVLVDQVMKGKLVAWLYKKLEILLIKGCDCCIAVSESLKEILISRKVPAEKIKVVYNPIEILDYDNEPDYYSSPLKMCTVGNFLPAKNYQFFLKTLAKLKEEYPMIKFEYDIYGDGLERNEIEKIIHDKGLNEVNLKGFDKDVRKKLNQYALYAQPSLYESFGIAVVEAMNAGCCVAVNPVGGMKEIVNEDSGYEIDCNNACNVINTIKNCYEDRADIQKKAQMGKKYVVENFNVDKMIYIIRGLYKELLGEKDDN